MVIYIFERHLLNIFKSWLPFAFCNRNNLYYTQLLIFECHVKVVVVVSLRLIFYIMFERDFSEDEISGQIAFRFTQRLQFTSKKLSH